MIKKFSKFLIICVIFLFSKEIFSAVPMQTVKDSMDGNRLVINGKKIFISGMNLAWINFGADVGDKPVDINSMTTKIKQIRKAGGNAIRWWLHTDASNCPKIDTTGNVTGLGANTIKNIRRVLDTAYAYGVVMDLCLFSFDMLVPGTKSQYSSYNLESNYKFLTDSTKLSTYLKNALKPLLDSIGSHPAIMCWEVFNEPEGMLASAGWSHVAKKITMKDILRITNQIAGFVHRNSKKMVSTGIASLSYVNEYSDAKLKAAGGDPDGYLDFYMVHYYPEWQDESLSPFHNPANHWGMDRPILIGEFPAKSWSTSTIGKSSKTNLKTSKDIIEAFKYAYDNGYAGAMSWAMTESDTESFGSYETTAPALKALFEAHKDEIMIKEVEIKELSGECAMLVKLDLPPQTYPEAEYNGSFNFTNVDSIFVDIYLPAGSSTDLIIHWVVKSTDKWLWCPSNITYTPTLTGQWVTYGVPISSFKSSVEGSQINLSDIRQLVLQFYTNSSNGFKGELYIDNVRYKKGNAITVVSDFNKEGSAWSEYESGTNDNISLSIVEKPENLSIKRNNFYLIDKDFLSFSFSKNILSIKQKFPSNFSLIIVDIKGRVISKVLLSKEVNIIDFNRMKRGKYIAFLKSNNVLVSKKFILY